MALSASAAALALLPAYMAGIADAAEPNSAPTPSYPRAGEPVAVDGDYYLEVFINGYSVGQVMRFHYDGVRLAASARDLKTIGLDIGAAAPGAGGDYVLNDMAGISYRLDVANLQVHLEVADDALLPEFISARARRERPMEAQSGTGLLFNYSLFASNDDIGRWTRHTFHGASGSFELRGFSPYGTLTQSFTATAGDGRGDGLARLRTTYSYSDQGSLLTFSAGDIVSGGLGWTRPIYMGGIQIRRNFALREDLVTLPTPIIGGSSAVPSTLDIYLDNARVASSDIDAGPFQVTDLPVITGRGVARVVVQGINGQETVTERRFYASARMLRRGLLDFSAEVGFARRGFGSRNGDDYDSRPIGSTSLQYGLNDRITLSAHAEGGAGLINGGGGATVLMGSLGTISLAGAASSSSIGTGGLVNAVLETEFPGNITFFASYQRTLGDYFDLASATSRARIPLGELDSLFRDNRPPLEIAQASFGVPIVPLGGNLGVTYTSAVYHGDERDRSRMLGASYSQPVLDGATIFVTGYADITQSERYGLFAGLSIPLGRQLHASASGNVDNQGSRASLSYSKSDTGQVGDLSYALNAQFGDRNRQEAWAAYRTSAARFLGSVQHADGNTRIAAQMDGAIVAMAGNVFFADRVQDSFAVVKTGAPGVTVMRENRPVGRSNGSGAILVTGLSGFTSNRISIDPTDLPIDASVTIGSQVVVPRSGGGVVVDFSVRDVSDAALVSFVDAAGQPIATGMPVSLNGGRETAGLVGYDGEAYLVGLSASNVAVIALKDGKICRASFDFKPAPGTQVVVRNVPCL